MLENMEVLCHSSIKINKEKIIYIDPFQDYINVEDPYLYGGVYVYSNYYNEFILDFDFTKYYKELSSIDGGKSFDLSNEESEIIKSIVLDNVYNEMSYNGIKQYLSEYSYDLNIKHKKYPDIYFWTVRHTHHNSHHEKRDSAHFF